MRGNVTSVSPMILLAGDSTVANYAAAERPMSGWGEHLGTHLNALLGSPASGGGVVVANFAKGGANTSSHRGEGLWDALLRAARPGDLVLIQFGHNDSKLPSLAARGGYRENLAHMVQDCRDHGLTPVLCTPVGRRTLVDGAYAGSHGEYPLVVRELAESLGVPLIDVEALSAGVYESYGDEGSLRLFMHFSPGEHHLWRDGVRDDTHFSLLGASEVARAVAGELRPLVESTVTTGEAR